MGSFWEISYLFCNLIVSRWVYVLNVIHFSGGKDSTAMLLMMLEKQIPVDYIIFCDTGKEFPQMYEHIAKVQEYIGREITILKAEKSFDYWMFDHVKTKGKHKGECGYGWATMGIRWCTSTMKKRVADKFLKSVSDCTEYIGIAFDEEKRHAKETRNNVIHPLYDRKITEAMALEYCYSKGFSWGGLYEHFKRVSCWCCPLKSLPELRMLYMYYPELWKQLKDMDNRSPNSYRNNCSIQDLENRFKREVEL